MTLKERPTSMIAKYSVTCRCMDQHPATLPDARSLYEALVRRQEGGGDSGCLDGGDVGRLSHQCARVCYHVRRHPSHNLTKDSVPNPA